MKKIAIAVLSILLVVSLASCDDMLQVMGAMGQSLAGVDMTLVEGATSTTTVDEAEQEKSFPSKSADEIAALDSKVSGTVVSGFGVDILGIEEESYVSIVTTEEGNSSIVIGDTVVPLSNQVDSMLPPVDLSSSVSALTGAAKEAAVEALKEDVTDEATKAAAQGTATVLSTLLEQALDEDAKNEEGMKDFLESLENMANGSSVSKGDVLVLQAATSMVASIGSTVVDIIDDAGETEVLDVEQFMGQLGGAIDSASSMVTIISAVSGGGASQMGTGFMSLLDALIK